MSIGIKTSSHFQYNYIAMKVIVAGDFCPRDRVAKMISVGDYSFLDEVKPLCQESDFAIVNFECPISGNGDKPIAKQGPNLQTIPEAADALSYAGFNVATTANNHILDMGEQAVIRTNEILVSKGVCTVGSGKNAKEAAKTLFVKKSGQTVAIINCCEAEFSLATDTSAGAFHVDAIDVFHKIKEAKGKADFVIVIHHGGHEMFQLPPMAMQKNFRFFVEAGADAVINHHQHVYSGYEVYNGKPILYGLGNFCFDRPGKRNTTWNEGYMVELNFKDSDVTFKLIPYIQCSEQPIVHLIDRNEFKNRLSELNRTICDRNLLEQELRNYYSTSDSQIENVMQPYSNRFLSALKYRNLLPSLIGTKTMRRFENYIRCESHRAKLLHWLTGEV